MFRPRQIVSDAIMEEACFEQSLSQAVKVTLAKVVGDCLPVDSVEAELSWWSVQCVSFDSNNDNGD